jgi:hypothetical protein
MEALLELAKLGEISNAATPAIFRAKAAGMQAKREYAPTLTEAVRNLLPFKC